MTLMVSTGTAPKAPSDIIKFETNPSYCRAEGVLLAGDGAAREIAFGEVLGAAVFGTPVYAAGGGNTGDGAASGLALKAGAQLGVYTLECITAATDAGVFAVFDPNGNRLADLTVAVAYDNGQFAITIADGAADFIVGDTATVTVGEGTGKLVARSLTAVDGTARTAGVAIKAATAADGTDGKVLFEKRGPATLLRDEIVYPTGASTDQKAAIDAELLAAGILVETGI